MLAFGFEVTMIEKKSSGSLLDNRADRIAKKKTSPGQPGLSVIMPFRNEGSEPGRTIDSILETCGRCPVEIFAVNDGGGDRADFFSYPEVKYLHPRERLGVDACRDLAIDAARFENILSIDAHMRFRNDQWLEKGLDAIDKNPHTIFCTTSVDIGSGNFDLEQTVLPRNHGLPYYTGASLKLFLTARDIPGRPESYRNIIEAMWAEERDGKIYPVPCLMGSNYFFKKAWFQKLHGFKGLKTWGSSEPFLSLKSWLAGGGVKIIKDIEIGHLYRQKRPNIVPPEHIVYNKAVMAKILFDPALADELLGFLGDSPKVLKARELFTANGEEIEAERRYFESIRKLSPREIFEKLRIDYTNPLSQLPKE
jgi:glycosyltransferase involved in cell wall biosynthesis